LENLNTLDFYETLTVILIILVETWR